MNWLGGLRIPASSCIWDLARGQKLLVVRFLAASVARSLLTITIILLIQQFLAGVLGGEAGLAALFKARYGAEAALWAVAILLILTYLFMSLATYDGQISQQRVLRSLELGVMERLIRHLLTLPVWFFEKHTHGDLIQAVRQDISQLRMAVASVALMVLDGMQAVGLLAAAIWISPKLAFWSLLVFPLVAIPALGLSRRTLSRSYQIRRRGSVLFDQVLQIIRGIRVIKVYRGEEAEARASVFQAKRYFDLLIEMTRLQSLAVVMLESVAGLGIVVVVIVGGFQVLNGTISWPSLLAFLLAVRSLHGPLHNVNSHYLQAQRNAASVARIDELLRERPMPEDAAGALPLRHGPGLISLENVCFAYDGEEVLHGLSFEVRAGETLGIAGPSGAGKSTLIHLIARFFDPTSGRVCFDGRDLRSYRLQDVYSQLALVPQEPFLFATSVRENIRCGRPEATDAEVEAAAAGARIHDEILALPEGYDTVLRSGGRGISEGQAQRLNIARALLKNAPILLLDEATSSLDSIAEAKVQEAIGSLVRGRTTFVVAHRLSTLRNADRILVVDGGRCVGLGSHEELLGSCPLYRRMWEVQHRSEPSLSAVGITN